ncbi:MAG: thioredoxin domain-containing protein [Kineosporiaceae bacterium]
MSNRLARSTSPYLQQHAGNPVDWWEWSPAAFADARRRDVPVLLSVGYAACHWCHVMAAESFDDPDTAADMNAGFVNVKVDREERPDVDAVYMQATTALTGHGGWPMTVFLTPDGRPFHAGTYYPPEPRHGMPSFRQVLAAVSEAWADRRDEVESVAHRLSTALSGQDTVAGDHSTNRAGHAASPVAGTAGDQRPPLTEGSTAAALARLAAEEDTAHGGFGGAPKFPPSMVLEFLLRHAASGAPTAGTARDLSGRALVAMARSGMYDQVGGGFARYAVDREWVVPHFEKMLSDNAQLARVYLHWWRLTGDPVGRRVAEETCDWMVRELGTAEGGLASSLDADTSVAGLASDEPGLADLARSLPSGGHGVEGLTYVWTPALLRAALGDADGEWAADLLGVTEAGTFHAGTSTLRLVRDPWADDDEAARWREARSRLRTVRSSRPQPARDDKVVAAWNGLAIAALAECGALLERPDLVAAAQSAATLLLQRHLVAGDAGRGLTGPGARLRRVSRDGAAGEPLGVLEDHGDVAEGLLVLAGIDGDPRWVEVALRLLDTVLDRFADPLTPGVLHDVASDALDEALAAVRRPRDPGDNAYPSGGSAAASALLRAAALTGRSRYREAAEAALVAAEPLMTQAPRFAGWWWATAQATLDGPREIAVVGRPGPGRDALHRVALAAAAPGAVVAVGEPGAGEPALLADRGEVAGRPAAHVCRGFVCRLPVTEPAELAREVGTREELLPGLLHWGRADG